MTKKLTKREMFERVAEALAGDKELVAFIETQIAQLDKKAAKAKETAAAKKADGDELTEVIYGVLTNDLTTIADITAKVDVEDITSAKVSYRLNALVKAGRAVKEEISIPGVDGARARRVQAFKLAD